MRKVTITICSIFIAFFFTANSAFSAVSHKAKSGVTHKKISKRHGKSIDSLKETNSHKSIVLKTTKKSRIKTAKVKNRTSVVKEAKNVDLSTQEEDLDNDEYIEYRVKRGENLSKVAEKFNIAFEDIVDLNKAAKKSIRPGSVIYIPKVQEESEDAPIILNNKASKPWKSEEERGILVKVAKSFAGAPYRYGGDSVRGLDCSAFVRKMYEIFNIDLPRSAKEQFCSGPRVNKEDLLTGDLVFFKTKRFAKYPTHVGIYLGDDMFIHASSTLKRGVKVDRLSDSYYEKAYTGAVRLKAPPQTERSDIEADTQKNSDKS
jgi:peptidoglycan DL-endopeptidase LytE